MAASPRCKGPDSDYTSFHQRGQPSQHLRTPVDEFDGLLHYSRGVPSDFLPKI